MTLLRNRNDGRGAFTGMLVISALLLSTIVFISCGQQQEVKATYRAEINPLNQSVTGRTPSGTAQIEVSGDSVTITVNVTDLPPNMMHLQHYHGFIDGTDATCAGMTEDANNDSIVDLIETEMVSGVTLVPFHDDPASLQIKTETYPVADSMGTISYSKTVSFQDLKQRMQQTHNIQKLQFEKRVVYIHGVSPADSLPATVASLPDVPAHITLPIACGKLKPVQETGSAY